MTLTADELFVHKICATYDIEMNKINTCFDSQQVLYFATL